MKFVYSLKRALLLNFLLAAVLPLLLFALFVRFYVGDHLLGEVAAHNHFLVAEIRSNAEEFLEKPVGVLKHIREIFDNQDGFVKSEINTYLEQEVRHSDFFESIYLLDKEGKVIYLGVSSQLEQQKHDYLSIDLSSHEIVSHSFDSDEVYWTDTFISVVTGKPSITLGLAVQDHVLVGNVGLENLEKIVTRFSTLPDLDFAIVDRKGILIAHTDQNKALQRVSMMYHPEVAKSLGQNTDVPVHTHEDNSMLETVLKVPTTGWAIWVGRDRETVLQPVDDLQNFMLIVLLFSIIVGTLQSVFNSRKVMQPISGLVDGASKMADGIYEINLPDKSYREIDELASGFNQMSLAVHERETSIVEREARFRNLVNSIEGVVWEFDVIQNKFLFVSAHCDELLGCSYEQWLESPEFWKTHIHPDDRQWVSDYFKGLSDGRLSPQFEFRMINSSGKLLWVRNMVNVVRSTDQSRRLYGVILDITDRKGSEIALRNSEVRFRSLVEQAADAIYIHDQDGRFVEVNEQACTLLGYARDELLTMSVSDVDVSHDPVTTLSIWNSVRHGETLTLDGEHRCKDGSLVPVEIRLGSFSFENEPLFLALARDVTQRRKVDAALRESEERFRNYFELGLIGMALTRRDGSYIQFNDRLCEIVGYERAELEHKKWADITHPEDIENNIVDMKQILSGEINRFTTEKRYVKKSGEIVFASISVAGVRNINGDVDHTIAIVEDITQRKNAENSLRESEEQVRLLLNSTAEGIYGIDLEGYCTFCNPSALKMLGYENESDFLGKHIHDLIHHTTLNGENISQEDCLICQAVEGEEFVQSDDDVFWRSDGSWFHTEYWGHRIEKDGELIGTVVTFHDVTERKLLQQQSIRTAQLASLGELAAGVAHEINNPINGVINYAQILLNRLEKNNLETDLAERIMKEGERIAVIVKDLLFFAREGGPEVRLSNISEVLSEALSLTEAQIKKEGILLNFDIEENLPLISTRAQQMQQLFLNVLSNARHALNEKFPGHDEKKLIEVVMCKIKKKSNNYVQIKIKDYGTGIPAEMLEKVMNPFVTTKPAGVGTGLGLSISHEIIENHHGDFRIESRDGEWTEVIIELPVADKDE
jgi:PAS domain S-box-containing protein